MIIDIMSFSINYLIPTADSQTFSKNLNDFCFIQDLKHSCYKYGRDLVVTYEGVEDYFDNCKIHESKDEKAAYIKSLDEAAAKFMAKNPLLAMPQEDPGAAPLPQPEAMPQQEPEAVSQEDPGAVPLPQPEAMPQQESEAMPQAQRVATYEEQMAKRQQILDENIAQEKALGELTKQRMKRETKMVDIKQLQINVEIKGKKDLNELDEARECKNEASLQRQYVMKLQGNQALFDQMREHAAILESDKRKRDFDVPWTCNVRSRM